VSWEKYREGFVKNIMQQQCRVQEQYTQYRKKIRNIYSVPDKKKT
jgi:hypothetical protein